MPLTLIKSSTDKNGLASIIFWAVAGPISIILSNSPSEAVFILTLSIAKIKKR